MTKSQVLKEFLANGEASRRAYKHVAEEFVREAKADPNAAMRRYGRDLILCQAVAEQWGRFAEGAKALEDRPALEVMGMIRDGAEKEMILSYVGATWEPALNYVSDDTVHMTLVVRSIEATGKALGLDAVKHAAEAAIRELEAEPPAKRKIAGIAREGVQ